MFAEYTIDIVHNYDEWAYDIEQQYNKNKYIEPKKKRQYQSICVSRDKYFDIYLKKIDKLNENSNGGRYFSEGKSCIKRFPPPEVHSQI